MTQTLDREYVLMALCGLIKKRKNTQILRDRYQITQKEYRRAAQIALQDSMLESDPESVAVVQKIAKELGMKKTELFRLAEKILRWFFFSDDSTDEDILPARCVATNYLKGKPVRLDEKLPRCCPGSGFAWNPQVRIEVPQEYARIGHTLLFHETCITDQLHDTSLPQVYHELLECVQSCLADKSHTPSEN